MGLPQLALRLLMAASVITAQKTSLEFPLVTGYCDDEHYYIDVDMAVASGSKPMASGSKLNDRGFKVVVGKRELTSELARQYNLHENATHFSLKVPFFSADAVFTYAVSSAVGGRLDVKVISRENDWVLSDFSLGCLFPMTLTECHLNGSVTVLALKVESTPELQPSQLTLRDPSCRPLMSTDRFATFSFSVNSCGTTRTFSDGYVIYENEITPAQGMDKKTLSSRYRLTVYCYYENEDSKTVHFVPEGTTIYPVPEPGYGEMAIRMRLATDGSYNTFYTEAEYPVLALLKSPLYFEIELLGSADPELDLFLESCWATLSEDGQSDPRWDLIVDGCPDQEDSYSAILHPVEADHRVGFPSHFKRFEMKMFAFVKDRVRLEQQIFVHCDAAICDRNRQSDGLCFRRCPNYPGNVHLRSRTKGGLAKQSSLRPRARQSAGPFHFA